MPRRTATRERVQGVRGYATTMVLRRGKALLAMLVIGDGVVGAVAPRRHMARWASGPRPYEAVMRPFVRHPAVTRGLAVGEVAAGLAYALRLPPKK